MPAVGAISALLWFIPKYLLIVILTTLQANTLPNRVCVVLSTHYKIIAAVSGKVVSTAA